MFVSKMSYCLLGTFDWKTYLDENGGDIAPSECFKQVCLTKLHLELIRKTSCVVQHYNCVVVLILLVRGTA